MAVFVPGSLVEALECLERAPSAQLLAGGTDFMVEVNAGRRRPEDVVALSRVPELSGWRREGDELVLGSGLTYTEMMQPEIARRLPGLAQAARSVGSPQIRNGGTLGGNLGTASPAGDTLPVLAVLGARLVVAGTGGRRRTVDLDGLVTGPKQTSLEPGEIILEARLPASVADGAQEFLKIGTRNAMVISVASLALAVDWAARSVRLAMGSAGPVVIRPTEAEAFCAERIDWEERRLADPVDDLRRIAALTRAAARPIDDHRSTAEYRRHAVGVCAARAVSRALGASAGAGEAA